MEIEKLIAKLMLISEQHGNISVKVRVLFGVFGFNNIDIYLPEAEQDGAETVAVIPTQ